MMLATAERARRGSRCAMSTRFWLLVTQCTVFISARSTPKAGWTTASTAARQLVVQEALETTRCRSGSKLAG